MQILLCRLLCLYTSRSHFVNIMLEISWAKVAILQGGSVVIGWQKRRLWSELNEHDKSGFQVSASSLPLARNIRTSIFLGGGIRPNFDLSI